ncbi:MAG TPA: glycosyltransferase family 4 protein [Actinomycetota bacterium]|nr:glycosyltransferase family 4 protein [Actinomycetota bacterium]
MRIAVVCAYDLDAPGGVQVHVDELAGRLAERGHAVEVFGPGRGGLGTPVRVRYRGTVAPIAPWPSGVRTARRALAAFTPDVVHVHEPFTPSSSMWASLAATRPVVATFHAWLDRSRLYEVAGPLLGPVRRRLAAAIAVSEAAAAFVRRALPDLDPVVIPNGLSVARFAGAVPLAWPPGRRIVWVHRLDRQKGFPVLVEAFRRVAEDRDDVFLTVAGDGTDRGAVHGLPAALRSRAIMLGRLEHGEVPSLLAGADVAVAAATGQESFGYSVVEAMAAGVPVVATDIEGYRQVATAGDDAVLVPPGDPGALAAAIGRVLDDEALSARLVEAGRRTATSFDWGIVTDRIVGVYRSVLERPSLR